MPISTEIHQVYVDNVLSDEAKEEDRICRAETMAIVSDVLGRTAIEMVSTPDEAQAMMILGGDGSFLDALHRHQFPDIPVTGINSGTLGFYMDTAPDESAIEVMARDLVGGRYMTKRLPMLEVPVSPEGDREYAANDVVVKASGLQAFKASLRIGGGEFEHFVGDGFVFATPQGSTSYSMSAGGGFFHEDFNGYMVTPSNPHMSFLYYSLARPATVPADRESIVTVKEVEKRPFDIIVDGFLLEDWPEDDDQVTVRVTQDRQLQMIRTLDYDYFDHISRVFRGKQLQQ